MAHQAPGEDNDKYDFGSKQCWNAVAGPRALIEGNNKDPKSCIYPYTCTEDKTPVSKIILCDVAEIDMQAGKAIAVCPTLIDCFTYLYPFVQPTSATLTKHTTTTTEPQQTNPNHNK